MGYIYDSNGPKGWRVLNISNKAEMASFGEVRRKSYQMDDYAVFVHGLHIGWVRLREGQWEPLNRKGDPWPCSATYTQRRQAAIRCGRYFYDWLERKRP